MSEKELDMTSVVPVEHVQGREFPGRDEFLSALSEARKFLEFYDWVVSIKNTWVGGLFDGIIYIFLFEIETSRSDVDRLIWVLVGDIPPTYIPHSDAANPFEALDGYIGAMEEWVDAASKGKSVQDLIPVNVPATTDNAKNLASRLKFLDEKILPQLKGYAER